MKLNNCLFYRHHISVCVCRNIAIQSANFRNVSILMNIKLNMQHNVDSAIQGSSMFKNKMILIWCINLVAA